MHLVHPKLNSILVLLILKLDQFISFLLTPIRLLIENVYMAKVNPYDLHSSIEKGKECQPTCHLIKIMCSGFHTSPFSLSHRKQLHSQLFEAFSFFETKVKIRDVNKLSRPEHLHVWVWIWYWACQAWKNSISVWFVHKLYWSALLIQRKIPCLFNLFGKILMKQLSYLKAKWFIACNMSQRWFRSYY